MSPSRRSRVTPGVRRTKLMKLRPRTGRLATDWLSTVELTWERVVSTSGVSLVTVTDSPWPATDSAKARLRRGAPGDFLTLGVSVRKPPGAISTPERRAGNH